MKSLRLPLMLGGTAAIVLVAAYYFFFPRRYESTDDAYVNAATISISTNVPGRVVALEVHDNERVDRGQVLFRLDDRPYRIAVEEARAKLGAARLEVEALKAKRLQKVSELRSAQETFAYEESEAKRQQRLRASGISSQAEVERAVHARDAAAQAIAAAQQEIASITAELGGDPSIDPAEHPSVQQAQAALDRAELDLSHTVIEAPDDGIVTQVEKLQVGDYVNEATPVFALIAIRDAWIDANFKEVQLANMRPGQPASVEIDAYGDKVFKGHVASFTPGTGAKFSVLPAQNATGNWVKVVQRLAVRIEIDDPDPERPLYAGLSATVKVDTSGEARPVVTETPALPSVSDARADESR
ncbi:MAG TPA: HlyD family secretion protein [Gammaproteobacteria bacterium]|nr:HlyD family secretion protein [Gammaproteobacteria bacterium]